MNAGKHNLEYQIKEEYSLFGGSDKLKPLRDTIMGGLYGDHLKTPTSEGGFPTQRDEGRFQEGPEEHIDTCNERGFWMEGSSPVAALDPWFSLSRAYGFGIGQQPGSPSGQASGFHQWGSLPPISPALQPLPPSPTQEVKLQSHCPNISVPQARACRPLPGRPHCRRRLLFEH